MTDLRFCEIHGKELNDQGECPSCLLAAARIAAKRDALTPRVLLPSKPAEAEPYNKDNQAQDTGAPATAPDAPSASEPESTPESSTLSPPPSVAAAPPPTPTPTPSPTPTPAPPASNASGNPTPSNNQQRGETDQEREARKAAAAQRFREQLTNLSDDMFAVMLIGNSTFGKSFVRKRLTKELGGSFRTRPDNDETAPLTDTMEMYIYDEVADNKPGKRKKGGKFAIFDMPGEYLDNLLGSRAYAAASVVIDAMLRANALIVTMPADVALFGDQLNSLAKSARLRGQSDGFKELLCTWMGSDIDQPAPECREAINEVDTILNKHTNLETFVQGIYELAVIKSYVEANPEPSAGKNQYPIDKLEFEKIENFRNQNESSGFGDVANSSFPVAIALTKADRVLPYLNYTTDVPDIQFRNDNIVKQPVFGPLKSIFDRVSGGNNIADHLDDHRKLLQSCRDDIVQEFDNWMPNNRISLVSAFYDHPGDDSLDYKLPHIGVTELIEWIFASNRRMHQQQRDKSWRDRWIAVRNYINPRMIDAPAIGQALARRKAMEGTKTYEGPGTALRSN